MKKLIVAVLVASSMFFMSSKSMANEVWPDGRAGNLGVGLDINAANLGIGPLAKYWVTENIGIQGTAVLGYLTGYSARAMYEFDSDLQIAGKAMNPYAGVGYATASREDTFYGITVETKGSAPQIFAGFEGKLPAWSPNFYWTAEVTYSPMTLEATATAPGGVNATVTSSYSAIDVGFSLVYYFPIGK